MLKAKLLTDAEHTIIHKTWMENVTYDNTLNKEHMRIAQ